MIKIDDKKWGEFKIDELFVVKRPVARSQVNYDDGNVAFVASSNYNNGVLRYCKPKEKEVLDKGNCITVSPLDASSFYQKNDFLGRGGAGSAIILLYNENLNLYNGLFIASVIRNKLTKYSYNNQLSSSSIIRETIKLPLKNGEPNWKYMEEYMIRIEKFTNKKILFLLSIIDREEVHNKNGGGV